MVQYRDLNAPPSRMLADVIADMKAQARQSKTGAHGVKDMGRTGDSVFTRPDGTAVSVRDVDLELEDARTRIGEAEESLTQTGERLEAAEQTVADVRGDLTTLETVTLPDAVAVLAAADQAAQEALGGLEERLGDFATDESLTPIREALVDAQEAVQAAQGIAEAANRAANAASQAALEAAGIASSKGRVIIQEAEPVGEDRNAANIWIKPIPDNPATEIEEKAVTYVYLEGSDEWVPTSSDELAQAAQNALDAREAAQQAQQRAEAAIANAATAQAAAEAAQRTADEATLDARDAHNAAVSAQGAANEALDLYGPLDQRTIDAQAAADTAQAAADAAYAEAASKATPSQVTAAANAAEQAAKTAAASDAKAKADAAQAEATRLAALDAKAKADAAQAEATRVANTKATPAEVKAAADEAERLAKAAAAADATAKADAAKAAAAADAKAKADAALAAARADLATARGQITAEIKASANGKNAITISTNAPTTSTPGVVAGDTWWRVDGSGNIFGQWRWTGSSWSPVTIRSEVIANLDVHKVTGTSGEFEEFFADNFVSNEAAIDNLWADALAARAITTAQVTVSPDNLVPNGSLAGGDTYWTGASDVSVVPIAGVDGYANALTSDGGTSRPYTGPRFPLRAGERYVFECWIRASLPDSRIYIELRDQTGAHSVTYGKITAGGSGSISTYLMENYVVPTEWTRYRIEFTARSGAQTAGPSRFYFNHPNGTERNAQVWIAGMSIRPMVGSVLIRDGAVKARNIEFTEELSGKVAEFMSVSAKEAVITGGLTANAATLIGQTVVDDINVQGKLIGTDGVFTGTVDFENVNVSDQLLAERLAGEHIYGTVIEGGEIRTTDGLPGQVILSDEGYVDSGNGAKYPGIRIVPPDTSQLASPPGIGPNSNGFIITGGRNVTGGRGFSIYTPKSSTMSFVEGSIRSDVQVTKGYVLVTTGDGNGNRGDIAARSTFSQVKASAADGTVGLIEATPSSAVVTTKDPGGNMMSQIMSNGREAYLWSTGSDGLGRVLSVDSDGVWVKTQRGDGSGFWDHVSLVPQVRPFQYSALWNADQSPAPIMVQHLPGGKLCQAQIRIQNLTRSSLSLPNATWVTLNYNPIPSDLRGGFTDYIEVTLPQNEARGRLEMNYSTGSIRIRNVSGTDIAWTNNNSIWFPMRWFSPN